jgi:hypothetical protein
MYIDDQTLIHSGSPWHDFFFHGDWQQAQGVLGFAALILALVLTFHELNKQKD